MQRRLNLNLSKALLMLGSLALFGGAVWLWLRPTQVATAEVTAREISPAIQGVGTVEAKVGFIAFFAVYIVLMRWVLPRLGVPT